MPLQIRLVALMSLVAGCAVAPPCGDGQVDAPEVCDGLVLNGETCLTRGFTAGTLKCQPTCAKFDLTACGAPTTCGNAMKEGVELCDGLDLGGTTCTSLGLGAGTLKCSSNCGGFDTSKCGGGATCGNGTIETGEVCDGAALANATCQSLGNDFGTLKCLSNCSGYDLNTCGKRGTHFDVGQKWTIPTAGGDVARGWYDLNGQSYDVGDFQWATVDMDGDGKPDLVSFSRAYQDPAPKTTTTSYPHGWPSDPHWLVFPNTGSGYGTGVKWTIPTTGGDVDRGWYALYGQSYDLGDFQWSLMDIDGDKLPDLVSFSRSYQNPAPQMGTTSYPHGWPSDPHWLVFKNTGTGFATGVKWTIPTAGGDVARGWYDLNGQSYDLGDFQWATLDIDGDGKPDLVSFSRSYQNPAPQMGTTSYPHGWPSDAHWLVFPNTGSGFGSGMKWAIPTSGGDVARGWYDLSGQSYDVGDFQWSLMDLDGDRKPDLVSFSRSYQDPAPMTTTSSYPHGWPSDAHWLVFKNTGTGFGAGDKWTIPTAGGDVAHGWNSLYGQSYDVGDFQWATMDLDGDHKPDLVSFSRAYQDPAPKTTTTSYPHGWPSDAHWLVFKNNGAGFETGLKWAIPPTGGDVDRGWYAIAGQSYDVGDFQWQAVDLNGDGRPDLVSHSRAYQDPAPKTTTTGYPHGWPADPHWLVFLNVP